jgi:hypothetical protein
MTTPQQELLRTLGDILDLTPELRMGQLFTNLTWLAGKDHPEATAVIDDEEMLEAARKDLRDFRADLLD